MMGNRKGQFPNDANEPERDLQMRKKTRWKGLQVVKTLSTASNIFQIFLLLSIFSKTATAFPSTSLSPATTVTTAGGTVCSVTAPHRNGSHVKCRMSGGGKSSNIGAMAIQATQATLEELAANFPLEFRSQKKFRSLDISCQDIDWPTRVDFNELTGFFPQLDSITLTGCNLTRDGIYGAIPQTLTTLSLVSNNLDSLPESMFKVENRTFHLKSVDLSENPGLKTLPESLLSLTSVQELRLGSNNFKCSWIGSNLLPWYEKGVIQDAKELDCNSSSIVAGGGIRLTVFGALEAKAIEKRECIETDQRCVCHIHTIQKTQSLQINNYPISFVSHGDNVSVTLNVTCSSLNLTTLPYISPLTRVLNVSRNQIARLDRLKTPAYANLKILMAEHNNIESVDVLEGTPFIKQFDILGLNHNRIKVLSERIVSVLLSTEVIGHGKISLEQNFLECTCDTYHMKLLLAKHHDKIRDTKNIFCRNFEKVKVQELEFSRVCPVEENYSVRWYIIIVIEVFLIFVVVIKVYHDSRQYRQTGILPWCSAKMPRLPCDFMLEGIKEGPNGQHH